MEAEKSQDLQSASWRLKNLNQSFSFCLKVRKDQCPSSAVRQEKFPPFLLRLFIVFRPSLNWMRPTHVREGHLLCSVYDSNINLTQNILTVTPRIMFDKMSGYDVPSQVDTQNSLLQRF